MVTKTTFTDELVRELSLERIAHGWALINRDQVQEEIGALFDSAQYQTRKALRDGRGQAYQVHGSFGYAVLRHYRRGGLTGSIWQDRYLFTGRESTRCFREMRLLAWLAVRGMPVPTPLACRFIRTGLVYRADLLTAWLNGAMPLSADVQGLRADDFNAVGTMLGKFHRLGLWHADLNAHNILMTDQGPALIDFDRCELRKVAPDWQMSNLARLNRSLTKLGFAAREDFQSALWPALLAGYHDN